MSKTATKMNDHVYKKLKALHDQKESNVGGFHALQRGFLFHGISEKQLIAEIERRDVK